MHLYRGDVFQFPAMRQTLNDSLGVQRPDRQRIDMPMVIQRVRPIPLIHSNVDIIMPTTQMELVDMERHLPAASGRREGQPGCLRTRLVADEIVLAGNSYS